jgi:hypothetical protein
MSTLIEVCFTKCQKLIQAFITEAPLCSAIYTKHICTQTKDLFTAVTSSSEELFQCMQTADGRFGLSRAGRTGLAHNHREKSQRTLKIWRRSIRAKKRRQIWRSVFLQVEQRAKCDGDCRRKSTFSGGELQGISSVVRDKFLDMMDQLRFMEKSPLFKGTAKPLIH